MYSSTGLSSEQITDLVARIHDLREAPASRAGRKPTLGLYKCVVVALIYLRSNRTQASIADQFHVSQKTISRTIASWMPILGQALQDCTPTVDDLDVSEPLIVEVDAPGSDERPYMTEAEHYANDCRYDDGDEEPTLAQLGL